MTGRTTDNFSRAPRHTSGEPKGEPSKTIWPPPSAARPDREERHEVVIVGAGLGGSIAAYRLSEAGVRNVVLERGRRWPIDPAGRAFPAFPSLDERLIWLDDESTPLPPLRSTPWAHLLEVMEAVLPRSTGLLDVITEDHAVLVCGAGVGGSTLVYGGVLAQPRPEAFHRIFPAGPDFELFDHVHYPRARRRLGGALFPADLLGHEPYRAHRLWDQAVHASGLPAETIHSSFDFDAVRDELRGDRTAAAVIGQYHFTGCNSGAKISVDRTYLARAEATGRTSLRPLHKVTGLSADRSGRYRVLTEHLDGDGKVRERVAFSCDRLVLAAGVHTPRLLLAARETGGLTRLHTSVGEGWSANGDHITVLRTKRLSAGTPQGGPSSSMVHNAAGTVGLMHSPVPLPLGGRDFMCLGMSIPEHHGKWLWTPDGRIRLEWNAHYDAGTQRQIQELTHKVARNLPDATEVVLPESRPLVAHPVGGTWLGKATDPYGRLHDHPGLYCLDGALMPGSTGAVNPALTIAAVVEYCLDHITSDFLDDTP
ncbi:GMC oxidoreductase [Streptomyces achromogenes]|uniref:GMC oxidoreductase n=1 Tax=Streptomyces achromogenes TaxID=67255 RepID=UPI0036FAF642